MLNIIRPGQRILDIGQIGAFHKYHGKGGAAATLWVAGGQGTNSLAWSENGTNWNGLGLGIFSTAGYGIAWNGSIWVAVGQGTTHTLAWSADGVNWNGLGKTIFSTLGFSVAWNGSIWVAVGYGATHTLAWSDDGVNWNGLGKTIFLSYGNGVASQPAPNLYPPR